MPTSCSSAASATTTSASSAGIPYWATTDGCTPASTSSRSMRTATFITIFTCTGPWSVIPSRSIAFTLAASQSAYRSSSALTSSITRCSRGLCLSGTVIVMRCANRSSTVRQALSHSGRVSVSKGSLTGPS